MNAFMKWFFSFITTMFGNVWEGISKLFMGIIKIFDFGTYIGSLVSYSNELGFGGWILSILALLLVYIFWALIAFIIALGIRAIIKSRAKTLKNEQLLEEISILHRDLDKAIRDKEKLIATYIGSDVTVNMYDAEQEQKEFEATLEEEEEVPESRFYRLTTIDEKFVSYKPVNADCEMNLAEICEDLKNFACFNSNLYYDIKTIRLMIAGLSTTKLIILQGISGTGKTSLPYVMGKYFENDAVIASVQPSWKDRSELFGFFNEFTKRFNETEVLASIYESSYNDDVNIIVLDEMNIARIEYYFAEMLSILELPDHDSWNIQLVPSVWQNDPKRLTDGKLHISDNIWYVGTANNDDSTYSVSDKVYDRAFVINLNSKGIPFEPKETYSKKISYSYIESLYNKAVAEDPVKDDIIKKIEILDNYVIEKFKIAFGNRIMKQLRTFVPVFKACGGDELDAIDYILVTKVFRKFEGLNLVLIRDEINGLISQLDQIFGKGKMKECINYLLVLKKSY